MLLVLDLTKKVGILLISTQLKIYLIYFDVMSTGTPSFGCYSIHVNQVGKFEWRLTFSYSKPKDIYFRVGQNSHGHFHRSNHLDSTGNGMQ